MHPRVQRIIDRIDNAAAVPSDGPDRRLRKTLLIFISSCAVAGAPLAAYDLNGLGGRGAAAAALAYAALSAAALLHLLLSKRETLCLWTQLTALLIGPAFMQWNLGGFMGSGSIVLWSFMSPVGALALLGPKRAVPWFASFAVIVLACAARDLAGPAPFRSPTDTTLLFSENLLLVASLIFIDLRYFIDEREKARAALAREQKRSEDLLLNILPAPIADRLKAESGTIADGFAESSVLFADIVGFTSLSAKVKPEELVAMLNRLFSRFDRLLEKHGVEKIKTIGDAYMACAGLPHPRKDHAEAVAAMALDMRRELDEFNKEAGSNLRIRIGVNSGPVVAGVIGLKKFIYDLWGDTVNLASRMESHGVPGRIQVSPSTRELLKERYEFEDRGELEVKGVGRMKAYLLVGPREK